MAMFDWLVEPPSMRGGSRCASTIPGGQCVITTGVTLMLQWSVSSLDMLLLDVSDVTLFIISAFGPMLGCGITLQRLYIALA